MNIFPNEYHLLNSVACLPQYDSEAVTQSCRQTPLLQRFYTVTLSLTPAICTSSYSFKMLALERVCFALLHSQHSCTKTLPPQQLVDVSESEYGNTIRSSGVFYFSISKAGSSVCTDIYNLHTLLQT